MRQSQEAHTCIFSHEQIYVCIFSFIFRVKLNSYVCKCWEITGSTWAFYQFSSGGPFFLFIFTEEIKRPHLLPCPILSCDLIGSAILFSQYLEPTKHKYLHTGRRTRQDTIFWLSHTQSHITLQCRIDSLKHFFYSIYSIQELEVKRDRLDAKLRTIIQIPISIPNFPKLYIFMMNDTNPTELLV